MTARRNGHGAFARRLVGLPMVKQLALVVVLYAVLVGGLFLLQQHGLGVLAGVKDQLGGHARAAESLSRYAQTRDKGHYREYARALGALVDHEATGAELAWGESDLALVYQRLRDGRAHPDAWSPVTSVTRGLGVSDDLLKLMRAWTEADGHLGRLEKASVGLHREIASGRASAPRIDRLVSELQRATAQLRAVEPSYSEALASVAGSSRALVERIALGLTGVAFVISVWISLLGARRLRAALSTLETRVVEVAKGDLGQHVEVASAEELGDLAFAFNNMTASLVASKQKAEDNSRELGKALRELENIMETIPDIICILDLLGRLDLWNRNLETVTGVSADDLRRKPVSDLFIESDRASIEAAVKEGLARGRFEVEGSLRRMDGAVGAYHWTGALLEDERGYLIGLTVSGRDITERKTLEDQLARQAFHDPLTNLPNRALFMDRLGHALTRTERRDKYVSVLFLDLDRFKVINDSLGHSVGDQLLVEVSGRLQTCLRPEDTVARLGGDEFGILVEDVEDVTSAAAVAERIAAQLETPFSFDGREVFISTSIGIALSPSRQGRPEDLLRDADLAMYHAKARGKARWEVFDASMNAPALERLDLEIDLRSAVARQEFRVYYQPVVMLETGRITEVEALVRWEHRQRGLLPPADFIGLTEETGLIVPIGHWVLTEACRQGRAWQAEYPSDPPLVISVNLSARQFQQPNLVQDIAEALRESGLDPACLKLEITESVVMHDAPSTLAKLRALKDLGIQLAIDDFGTGYSSLGYLKRFPVDTLKIDRSFVKGVGHDAEDMAIVRAVVTVAKSLNLSVTAEGIETDEQLAQLVRLGCDRGQGYYFARPLAADPMRALFSRLRARPGEALTLGALVGPVPISPVENGLTRKRARGVRRIG